MTAEHRAALRTVAESLPVGTAIPVVREDLLALLGDEQSSNALPSTTELRLLTVAEVAARLGMGEQYVYRRATWWPFTRRIGRAIRFDPVGFGKWLARRGAVPGEAIHQKSIQKAGR